MKLNIEITKRPTRKGFTLVELLVVMAIIAVLASIATPLVLRKTRDGDKTKAIAHARQCQLAFFDFYQEYGSRPGQQIVDNGDLENAEAGSANQIYRQLFLGLSTVRSEAIFYAPCAIAKEPDNDIGDKDNNFAEAVEKGEVAFLYLDNPNSKDGAPLMAAPLSSTNGPEFDFERYNGKAVVLKTDGSVITLDIDEDSQEAMITVRKKEVNVLSTNNKTFRNAPEIKYPE